MDNNVEFRNYCAVFMANVVGVIKELNKVSETEPNYVDAGGIFIATFTSTLTPAEMTDFFKDNNRTFVVFDLNENYSGFHFLNEKIHKGMFGFLEDTDINEKKDLFMANLSGASETRTMAKEITDIKEQTENDELTEATILKLTPTEKNDLINKLIGDGKNISKRNKELIMKLNT